MNMNMSMDMDMDMDMRMHVHVHVHVHMHVHVHVCGQTLKSAPASFTCGTKTTEVFATQPSGSTHCERLPISSPAAQPLGLIRRRCGLLH